MNLSAHSTSSAGLHIIPVIVCGGQGTRLWPFSRECTPKPFISLADGECLLRKTFVRALALPDLSALITICNEQHLHHAARELRGCSAAERFHTYILEPFGKNTAAPVAAACLYAQTHYDPQALLLVMPADQLIADQHAFTEAVKAAADLAQHEKIVTFGISPTAAETGYGYIQHSDTHVLRFLEKPDQKTAQTLFNCKDYLWNAGIFAFTAKTMLKAFETHAPHILNTVDTAMHHAQVEQTGTTTQIRLKAEHFEAVPENSIDRAVMEKTTAAAVVPCDMGWSDIGSWEQLGQLLPADADGNHIQGDVVMKDTQRCIIHSKAPLIGAVGVRDMVIVADQDAILVTPREQSQDVRHLYEQLQQHAHPAHQIHRTVQRPWGSYTVLEEGPGFKVKRIEVEPQASLSLQMHQHRNEHWVITQGQAKVQNGTQSLILGANQSTYIPAKNKHRLENIGDQVLVLIEVQTGTYLGEDDIVRFADHYGRVPSA